MRAFTIEMRCGLYKHLDNLSGIAETQAELGGVLLSQGHFEQGLRHLGESHEGYLHLKMPERAASVQKLYQVAQKKLRIKRSRCLYDHC